MPLSKGNQQAREVIDAQANKCLTLSAEACHQKSDHSKIVELQKEMIRLNTMGKIGNALEQMENAGLLDDQTGRD